MSKSMTTAKELSPKESKMDTSTMPQSLPISEHSLIQDVVSFTRELRISLRGASHAKIYLVQDQEKDLMERDLGCGKRCHRLFAELNPSMSLWKIPQCSLFEDLEQSLEIWPKWGLMQNGVACQRLKLELPIIEKECGLLPTPRRFMAYHAIRKKESTFKNLEDFTPNRKLNPDLVEDMMVWVIGWTDLKPLETGRFQQWLRLHGRC